MRASSFFAIVVLVAGCAAACSKRSDAQDAAPPLPLLSATAPSASSGVPRPGMAWIPSGILKAGSRPFVAPRVAEEELPWIDVELHGFYIDLLPYPNEPGAIPTSNVTREDADKLCQAKGKRLCTELEWERACKGPKNWDYEYADLYRGATCGTGVPADQAARRPSGERSACKSDFGVMEMHGGVWEWTSSSWGRNSKEPDLAVLRGGNAEAGELVGRCANAIARSATTKSATMGFRCCAGPPNEARVELSTHTGLPFEGIVDPEKSADFLAVVGAKAIDPKIYSANFRVERAWTWRPVANEKLVVGVVCTRLSPRRCAVVFAREDGPREPLTRYDAGENVPDVAPLADTKVLRARGLDFRGSYTRELTYAYGRVEVGDAKRP